MLLLLLGAGRPVLRHRRRRGSAHPAHVRVRRHRHHVLAGAQDRERARGAARPVEPARARRARRDPASASPAATSSWATSCCSPRATAFPPTACSLDALSFSVDESLLTGESVPVRKRATTRRRAAGQAGRRRHLHRLLGDPGREGPGHHARARRSARPRRSARSAARCPTSRPSARRCSARWTGSSASSPRSPSRCARCSSSLYALTQGPADPANWLRGLLAGITLAMAMLPEEFPVVLTVFLALGAWRISRVGVLTRRMPAVETLGSATVLATDKTGTLTQNRMTVRELRPLADGVHRIADADGDLPEPMHEIVEYSILASPVDPFDPMDTAFKQLGERYLANTEHVHRDWSLVREYPLSEHLLALSHVWRSQAPRRLRDRGQGRARGDRRPVPPRRPRNASASTRPCRRWPTRGCGCSAWRALTSAGDGELPAAAARLRLRVPGPGRPRGPGPRGRPRRRRAGAARRRTGRHDHRRLPRHRSRGRRRRPVSRLARS